mgnify:FL=1
MRPLPIFEIDSEKEEYFKYHINNDNLQNVNKKLESPYDEDMVTRVTFGALVDFYFNPRDLLG